jgi:hypothetical protein
MGKFTGLCFDFLYLLTPFLFDRRFAHLQHSLIYPKQGWSKNAVLTRTQAGGFPWQSCRRNIRRAGQLILSARRAQERPVGVSPLPREFYGLSAHTLGPFLVGN